MSLPKASSIRQFTAMERLSNGLFLALHVTALLAVVVRPSAHVLLLAVGGYGLRMWAITAGYHRYFAHRTYKTTRAFQLILAVLGATTMQNGPIWWASVHRRHHKHADAPGDPHSPVLRGFWYAHIGWAFDRRVPAAGRDACNVRDLTRYPELRWVDRHDWVPLIAYAGACLALGGWPGLLWGFVVSTLAVFHATMLINSLAHVWGSRRYETDDDSRNNALLALLTLGEGWHNNHHHHMGSARQGFFWWEVDVTYYVLRLLSRLRVVWDLHEPREADFSPSTTGLRTAGAARRSLVSLDAHPASTETRAPEALSDETPRLPPAYATDVE